jgi:Ca-activated chloride channel family protein
MPGTMQSAGTPASRAATGLVAVDGKRFPLRSVELRAAAAAGWARTTLEQHYENPHAEPLEVEYLLPLPADGVVVAYSFRLGERAVTGRIEKREEARRRYANALVEGRTAGLLEQQRADTFTQKLGNLPAGAAVSVRIEVLQPLAYLPRASAAAQWEYRFPTVVGVRYVGAPGDVSDAEALFAPRAEPASLPVRVSASFELADGAPESLAVESPSHELRVAAKGLELAENARLDRDLVLRWNASALDVAARLFEGAGLEGDDGRYAALTITPPAQAQRAFSRDLTVLIDASGSMSGAPLESAKSVVLELLRSLAEGDRFELLAFADEPRSLTKGLCDARPSSIDDAIDALKELRAGGGTEMASAVTRALEPLRSDAQRQVVLVTDGYIGAEAQVVERIARKLPAGSRVHCVGVGSSPCRALTRGAARAGRGVELIVTNEGDAKGVAESLVRATARPVLTEIRVEGPGLAGLAPAKPRDVFAGEPLRLLVELAPGAESVVLSGNAPGSAERWSSRVRVETPSAKLPLGAAFGRELVADIESGAVTDATAARIEQLGLRHRIVTSRTSLVAVTEDVTVDPTNPRRFERLAVEVPFEVSAEGVGFVQSSMAVAGETMFFERMPARSLGRLVLQSPVYSVDVESIRPRQLTGRIVSRRGRELVLEFASSDRDVLVPSPGDALVLVREDGSKLKLELDPKSSTRPGRVAKGLVVRLVLRLPWLRKPLGESFEVRWSIGGEQFSVYVDAEEFPTP